MDADLLSNVGTWDDTMQITSGTHLPSCTLKMSAVEFFATLRPLISTRRLGK